MTKAYFWGLITTAILTLTAIWAAKRPLPKIVVGNIYYYSSGTYKLGLSHIDISAFTTGSFSNTLATFGTWQLYGFVDTSYTTLYLADDN